MTVQFNVWPFLFSGNLDMFVKESFPLALAEKIKRKSHVWLFLLIVDFSLHIVEMSWIYVLWKWLMPLILIALYWCRYGYLSICSLVTYYCWLYFPLMKMKIRCFRRMKVNSFWSKCARSKLTGLILSLFMIISVCLSVCLSLSSPFLSPPPPSLSPPPFSVCLCFSSSIKYNKHAMLWCSNSKALYISNFTNVKSCMSPVTFIIRKTFFPP